MLALVPLIASAGVAAADEKAPDAKPDPADVEFFEKRIRPVLVQRCFECHSAAKKEPRGGLRLDSRAAILEGGYSGPSVMVGKPDDSLLLQSLKHDGLKMPPGKKLSDAVITDFAKWIERGAVFPDKAAPKEKEVSALIWEAQFAERIQWWSLQPVASPRVPTSHGARPIDAFIRAALEAKSLKAAPQADRATLARRLSFVLTGLPPEPDEVDAFVADSSPEAWERLVDRTLASPHFGEHFARHWMDVVRFGDTYGYEWDIPAKGAWRYRDYLIRAFNDDIPYDQLVREQIAGDLLEHPRTDPVERINVSLIGPMFYQLGEKRHGDSSEFDGIHQEMLDNKIDAFSKAFQAMTVACARCHDHKLDAIAQAEYYAVGGAFMSSRWVTRTLDLPERDESVRREMKAIKAELRTLLANAWRAEAGRLGAESFAKLTKQRGDKPFELTDALFAWSQLEKTVKDGKPVADAWKELAARYQAERAQRAKQNAEQVVLVADFRQGLPEGWSAEGVGVREIAPRGDFTVALAGDGAIGRVSLGGLVTNSLSPRMNGAIRTPFTVTMEQGILAVELCGGDFAAQRTVYDNAFLTEKQTYLNRVDAAWQSVNTVQSMRDRRIYIEFATKTSNPNFPPRVGLGGACSEEQVAQPQSWFGISRVVRQKGGQLPADELARFAELFTGDPPATLDEAAARYRGWFEQVLARWAETKSTDDDVVVLNWMLDAKLVTNRRDVSVAVADAASVGSSSGKPTQAASATKIGDLIDRYRRLEARLAEPQTVNGMADIDPGFDYRLNIRGEYDQLGDAPPRGYVKAVTGRSAGFGSPMSGRRELAEFVASPTNPLTARVYVNRVWQWLFGQGLVTTPDDFGHLGDTPSHPELLDHLASRFMADGWSTKRLVREIVLTETWRQSGETTDAARAADPNNRLLHHYRLQRLEAEPLRDAILAASGRLSQQLYGPPVNPNRPKEDPQKRLFSGPIDGDGRRSLYTKMTVMEVPRFLATFNQPDPKIPTGRRDVTNTAAQSLALLNDPLLVGQAEAWSRTLVAGNETTVADRLTRMFRTAYGRSPSSEELLRWSDAVNDFAASRNVAPGNVMASPAVWQDVAHAVLNTKEMIYVR